jgi:hypothetical protein
VGILDYQLPSFRQGSSRGNRVCLQQHNPNSIATLRLILARSLICQLWRCPLCGRPRLCGEFARRRIAVANNSFDVF